MSALERMIMKPSRQAWTGLLAGVFLEAARKCITRN
jgi:hypothetical protein